MTEITGKGEMIFSPDVRVHLRQLGREEWAAYLNREVTIMCVEGREMRGALGWLMNEVMAHFAVLKGSVPRE
jgi:hypothetical protein